MDVLSDVITTMRTGRPASRRLRVDAPWCYRFDPYEGAGFHILLRGTGWLLAEGAEPVPLATGDVVLVPRGSAHVLSHVPRPEGAVPLDDAEAEPEGRVEFLCGKYRLDHTRGHPLLGSLPDVVHLPAGPGRHAELRAAVDLLAAEVTGGRSGRDAVVSGLLDLLLVYMARAWFEEHPEDGWPRALRDREVAAVLEALHTEPAAPWRLEELAARVGLSRATLARRFTALTGQPPMTYLTWWRMTSAAHLLRTGEQPLTAVARQVGYGSPFAFSHAFKRHFGRTPAQFRADASPPEPR
ncbi:AraC family transcriptional regulator [Streptomyces griseoaurantiacus]|uniref:AraC family transcriptional regulator n=1 Tax=Streptomyces griseoaurantiacus TaxID=68213 RepID=A0A7W2DVT7_9ACTN|nr:MULTISPECIES: AraC family transcriptional regulator [Streptomyces]MBA5223965.1 AraC family transcriptional regulator [Streptomyces griseoaurantiacus]WTI30580.1 AraC family transcriptional regulator [Streptomyces jietaisiensis]GHE60216.1 AraC family transcriptional regulator [Streptomyces griseoaurantiacus]